MPGNEIIGKEEFSELKKYSQQATVFFLLMLLIKEEREYLE